MKVLICSGPITLIPQKQVPGQLLVSVFEVFFLSPNQPNTNQGRLSGLGAEQVFRLTEDGRTEDTRRRPGAVLTLNAST